MLRFIDNFLNKISMYRLVLYYLSGLLLIAIILSSLGLLPFKPLTLIYSIFFVTFLSWVVNTISAYIFKVPTNVESVYITSFILILIISPDKVLDFHYFAFLSWAAIWSQASKYVISLNKKHIFNPAAFAVALTGLAIGQAASWWVGTASMLPFVLIGGFLMVRKLQRFSLVLSYIIIAIIVILTINLINGQNIVYSLQKILTSSPLFFLGFVMLTEPLTTPPTRRLQILYGSLVGLLFAPQVHVGQLYSTPELALLVGNIFSYLVSPKKKFLLRLSEKIQIAPSIYNFVFQADAKINFRAGQYLEWTLNHKKPDRRGNRRYFTIASAPTEKEIIIGVKFYKPSSSFKESLQEMQLGDRILAGQLAGDFTLSKNPAEKSVFIAGGIGITPFRSIIKNLIDTDQKRNIVLFISNKTFEDIVYEEIFEQATKEIGIRVIYVLSDSNAIPKNWSGKNGFIDAGMICEAVPDFKERNFYISGPHAMVTSFKKVLQEIGVKKSNVKTDFFPGFV